MEAQMKRQIRLYLLALGILGARFTVLADGPAITSIDYPGATSTQAWGINNRGDIVGFYTLADQRTHGFLLTSDGNFSSVDFPGAASTSAVAINSYGDIVGSYAIAGVTHGFVLSGGKFKTIDFSRTLRLRTLAESIRKAIWPELTAAVMLFC
jgi:probable HAF family extracellular repeat protein